MCLTLSLPFLRSAFSLQQEAAARSTRHGGVARSAFDSWDFVGATVTAEALRSRYAGVVFVGDSQIREVAWAALLILAGRESHLEYAKGDPHFTARGGLHSACSPGGATNYGWTALCNGSSCAVHSPPSFRSTAESDRTRLNPSWLRSQWDGGLIGLDSSACDAAFFVSFEALRGTAPLNPSVLPSCLRSAGARPVLWVVNGGGLQELASRNGSAQGTPLPQVMLQHFATTRARRNVVWLPTGGGFHSACDADSRCTLHASHQWLHFQGKHEGVDDLVRLSAAEVRWLEAQRVAYVDYAALAQEHSAAMSDGRHFAYHLKPCVQTFPEVTKLVAQLALQSALEPTSACAPQATAYRVAPRLFNAAAANISSGKRGYCANVWSYRRRLGQEASADFGSQALRATGGHCPDGGGLLAGSVGECVERCAVCSSCRFISYGHKDHDCALFRDCLSTPQTQHARISGHHSYEVRSADGFLAAWLFSTGGEAHGVVESLILSKALEEASLSSVKESPEWSRAWPAQVTELQWLASTHQKR